MSHAEDLRGILARVKEIQDGAEAERRLWVKAVDEAKAELAAERTAHTDTREELDMEGTTHAETLAKLLYAVDQLAETKAELTEAYARRDVVRATHAKTRKELRAEMEGIIVNAFETRTTDYQADVDWPGVIEDIELALAVVDRALGIPTEQETP